LRNYAFTKFRVSILLQKLHLPRGTNIDSTQKETTETIFHRRPKVLSCPAVYLFPSKKFFLSTLRDWGGRELKKSGRYRGPVLCDIPW